MISLVIVPIINICFEAKLLKIYFYVFIKCFASQSQIMKIFPKRAQFHYEDLCQIFTLIIYLKHRSISIQTV